MVDTVKLLHQQCIEIKLTCYVCIYVYTYNNIFLIWMNIHIVTCMFICPKLLLSWTCKFLKHIVPVSGQLLGGLLSSITRGASLVIFVYWRILSTDIILFSALHMFHITEACNTFRLIPYVTANPAIPATNPMQKNLILNWREVHYLIITLYVLVKHECFWFIFVSK